MRFKKSLLSSALLLIVSLTQAQTGAAGMAATVMRIWKDSLEIQPGRPVRWSYDQGVVLEGFTGLWRRTGNQEYFRYMQKSMDHFVDTNGNIHTYQLEDYNIDNVKNGRILLTLYKATKNNKYKIAADHLREQLRGQPRTNNGGFWHKKRYPWQMWLDGLYMGEPFYAEYAVLTGETGAFRDITRQFVLMEQHARDSRTGLLYHAWDESKEQRWANKTTGQSPHFWGRAMGWYAMALVDALEYYPAGDPGKDSLIAILNRTAAAVKKYQDAKTGCWYQVLDKGDSTGNYVEASASCMFVYALAKGMRLGYLPSSYRGVAEKGYKGILKQFIRKNPEGDITLSGTVSVAGLGGDPYRDGSYAYYLSEKVIDNDPKGVGAYILAANEMEMMTK
ncbi:glycoside hydrolase family 88/105 protein [Chitinophaga ginsengisegetis]|uniref:glycoside hydrolase family 88/105 protein n=1 Tax=Chitinophaga ginsengisegetis TaxID=393003 RepID=UPI000DBACADB|nr:glycoside hydrolase family 88 protein [Chitinophaga ginsengisegetis]MDR6568934.1 rhamnogalacturonyl hydrolase YesR [Chitinophaga ginsengisegetis]MDR6649037.1 rhamnogalacturonyl hydrolase YesR [Chitinophaga ginsengisegetis]MDR6655015.1 rhamnogalacturonyl hydrolase YesR [Chitinophaga ginsengisegetis]